MRSSAAICVAVVVAFCIHGNTAMLDAQTSPIAGFVDSIVLTGFDTPTVVAFSADGRVFVGEKSGIIKVFESLSDPTASVFADLRTQVHNYADRGLLGMALHPNFPATPYLYVLYTADAVIGGAAPRWGSGGATSDGCPTAHDIGCVASGRLSRLQVSASSTLVGTERVLIQDWFQQFNSHSVGSIVFGADGALYASAGDAASWEFVDYGQKGNPPNPAGDPPVPVGGLQTPPSAEGGALRAQDLRTDGDPVGLSGSVIRVNPETGAAMPDNPQSWHRDPNARRIVAYGLRNPFRITARPGTRELWVGDVGWREYEEINVIPDPATAAAPTNFGWPCYDGTSRQPGYDSADLNMCENLYAETGAVSFARFQYREGTRVVPGETCSFSDSALGGLAFYEGGTYPAEYDGALFFGDYARRCIWVMFPSATGVPDPATRKTFVLNAATPVDLKIGPGGDLFYVDIAAGAIHRIIFNSGNEPPDAVATASPDSGRSPLSVTFDATRSRDPEGGALRYDWDLDGNGQFGDATIASPTHTYTANGTYIVTLRVTDVGGLRDTATVRITVGNTAPAPVIDTPLSALRWQVGQAVSFSGRASDAEDGTLPASSLTWALIMNHCSSATSCHEHFTQAYAGVASGSFRAPSHEYPSYLTLRLTARDSGGLERTASVRLNPQAVALRFETVPAGLQLALGSDGFAAPATRTVIVGSANSLTASSPQSLGGTTYEFVSWSNGGSQTQVVTAPAIPTTYRATFRARSTTIPAPWVSRDIGSVGVAGSSGHAAGTFIVRGAGADIWNTADAFHYAYRTMAGDGAIVARVATVSGTDNWTKVGVMIRASADPRAANAFLLVSTSRGLAFQRRNTTGGVTTQTAGGNATAPRWVRLARAGNLVTASLSPDGITWTKVGQDTIALPATALVGLAVTSHRTSSLATGTFDNVTVTIAAPIKETVLLEDNFHDDELSTDWHVANLFSGYEDAGIPVTETNQRLQIGPLAANRSGSHFNGIASARAYGFAGGYAYVELVQPPTMSGVTYAMFAVGINSTNYYRWYVSGARLYAQSNIGGIKVDLANVPYDPVAHRFWRIREVAGRVEFHTAPGTGGRPGSWTLRAGAAWNGAVPLGSLKFEMKAGTLIPHATPGTAIFDTFKAAIPDR
jgi:glucose/arabinose dehydrogenase